MFQPLFSICIIAHSLFETSSFVQRNKISILITFKILLATSPTRMHFSWSPSIRYYYTTHQQTMFDLAGWLYINRLVSVKAAITIDFPCNRRRNRKITDFLIKATCGPLVSKPAWLESYRYHHHMEKREDEEEECYVSWLNNQSGFCDALKTEKHTTDIERFSMRGMRPKNSNPQIR